MCCCSLICNSWIFLSRASALARHRSRDRRRSRNSVRNALIRCCSSLYFAFQRSRLRSKNRASTRAGLRCDGASWSLASGRDMVCGSIRNKGFPPTTDIAQQISPISQAQLPLKKDHFHQPRVALPRDERRPRTAPSDRSPAIPKVVARVRRRPWSPEPSYILPQPPRRERKSSSQEARTLRNGYRLIARCASGAGFSQSRPRLADAQCARRAHWSPGPETELEFGTGEGSGSRYVPSPRVPPGASVADSPSFLGYRHRRADTSNARRRKATARC